MLGIALACGPVAAAMTDFAPSARVRLAPSPVGAGGTIVVMNCNDDGNGSLREAVRDLAVSGDTIDLRFLTCSTITLTTGAIATNLADLRLVGNGPYRPTISAANASSVFIHAGSGTLTLEGLTVQDGRKYTPGGTARGGCVFSTGDVVLSNAIVRACVAEGDSAAGGGIHASGDLSLFDSAIGANVARAGSGAAKGGGAVAGGLLSAKYSSFISNTAEAAVGPGWGECGGVVAANANISGSTVFGNIADYFAGVCTSDANAATPLRLRNSTVSNNHAIGTAPSAGGAGVHAAGTVALYNSTVAQNFQASIDSCAGLWIGVSGLLESSLVADNVSGFDGIGPGRGDIGIADLCGAATATIGGSHNLVRASSIPLPQDTIIADPRIGSLTPTHVAGTRPARWVHPLLPDSPALDTGSNAFDLDHDQRGTPYARTVGAATDIGAYELDPDRIFVDGFD